MGNVEVVNAIVHLSLDLVSLRRVECGISRLDRKRGCLKTA